MPPTTSPSEYPDSTPLSGSDGGSSDSADSSPQLEDSGAKPAHVRWSPLEIALMVGAVLLITINAFEAMATTTIMPNVVADLGAESWFSVASGAALAAQLTATVIAGGLSDSRGPRIVLIGGTAVFLAGVLICATAPHIAVFVAGRLIQGVGGGLVIVPLYVLTGLVGDQSHRPAFFAAFSMAWVLPSIVGPALAGWITTQVGWRWVFGGIPLVALLACIPLLRVLYQIPEIERQPARKLGYLTLFAGGAGAAIFLLQLSGALEGIISWALIGAGFILLGITLPRLLPAGTLTFRQGLPSLVATRAWMTGAFTGATAILPLLLQRVHEWTTESAAIAVTIGSVGWSFGSLIQSRFNSEQLRVRLPLIGTILVAVGLIPLSLLLIKSAPLWPVLLGLIIAACGIGLAHSSLSVRILDVLPRNEHGKGSSWLQVADSAGGAVELAATSILLGLWAQVATDSIGFTYIPAPILAILFALGAVFAAFRGLAISSSTRAEQSP
ncbi:MAG: MFS transporter [Actinomycetaceae bacterium]|nr:MFS transporter [Actinomycetaceae bacterium]